MISKRLQKFQGATIFEEVLQLIKKHNAVNLSSGFPQWKTPTFLKDIMKQVLDTNEDQYALPGGHPQLRDMLATIYSNQLQVQLEGQKNVFIGNGATGVLFDSVFSLIDDNDEIVTFDPFFINNYVSPQLAGGILRNVPLIQPTLLNPQWMIDFDRLEAAFNQKTKFFIINSPHNPTGRVFTDEEYYKIAKILEKFPQVIIVCDEVYDYITFDGKKFPRIINQKNLFDRTIIIGSLGKKFSCTGWRCGYAIANQIYIKALMASQQYVSYSATRPQQVAFAIALEQAYNQQYKGFGNYFQYSCNSFEQNRNWILNNFVNCPIKWKLHKPEGGFFMLADISDHVKYIPKKYFYKNVIQNGDQQIEGRFEDLQEPDYTPDIAFSKYLIEEYQVAVLPISSFYNNSMHSNIKNYEGRYLVRIALCIYQQTFQLAQEKIIKINIQSNQKTNESNQNSKL